jgi:curli biogenesis system outer membrane secretion channel CsgG
MRPPFFRSRLRSAAFVMVLATTNVGAQPATPVSPRLRVAVMDLTGTALRMQQSQTMVPGAPSQGGVVQTSQTTIAIPPPAEFARSLTEALTTALVATNRFVVLERLAITQVQQEQDLGASGRVNRETAPDVGKLMGAQVMITGDITSFTFQRSAVGGKLTNIVRGLDAGVARITAQVTIDLRLIDVVSGEVIASIQGAGSAAQQGVTAALTRDERSYDGSVEASTPLGKASREAITQAVAGIVTNQPKMRWSARVIDFRDGVVYVNAGSNFGMQRGTVLDVFDPQPSLLDPETGRNLGAPDRLVGSVTVEQVEAQYSTARVVKGAEFKRDQVVRLKGSGPQP